MDLLADREDFPTVRFKNAVDVDKMLNEGVMFEVNLDDYQEEQNPEEFDGKDVFDNLNMECLGLHDEDCFQNEDPFEVMAKKMQDLTEGIKKRVLRSGTGDRVPEHSTVYIDYNAYLEYSDTPFDSTYLRKKQHVFRLGEGQALHGLDLAVRSMRANEKSQFLIQPDLAYGKMGCFERIPPNSVVLFEVELKRFVNSGVAEAYSNLTPEDQNKFEEIYKRALASCEKAKELFSVSKNYKAAIRQYNLAVTKLENCQLLDYEQQESQKMLLLRLYTNLMICYNRTEQPRLSCVNANKIFYMCKETSLQVPVKVLYNNAKALMMLNDLPKAEQRLREAARRDRDNQEIVRCFLELSKLKEEQKKRDKLLARMLVGSCGEANEEFKANMREICTDLKQNLSRQVELPVKLSVSEKRFVKEEAARNGLKFEVLKSGETEKLVISKVQAE